MNSIIFSSKNDEWETPAAVFEELNKEFDFNYDPCATRINKKCEFFDTEETNGLETDWGGGEYSAILHTPKYRNG